MGRRVAPPAPARGDIWDYDPDPTRGREQRGSRPGVILSADWFNGSGADLVAVVPCTTRDRGLVTHVPVPARTSGFTDPTFVMCDQVRTIAVERLRRRRGALPPEVLARVEDAVRYVLDL